MNQFKPGYKVKCYGSIGQFLCYGIVKSAYNSEYYDVGVVRDYPNMIIDPDAGGICLKEDEMELYDHNLNVKG